MKLLSPVLFLLAVGTLANCYSLSMGTIPYIKLEGPVKPYSEERPNTEMVRTCPLVNLNDAMTNFAGRGNGAIGIRDFEVYSTPYGVTGCLKVRGVLVTK